MPAKTKVKWRMKGQYMKNCSCDAGCPCDFNQKPTHTVCEGMMAMNIQEGHFEDVVLSGVKWAATYKFPGPLHLGNGRAQPIIDVNATQKQRDAMLQILSGKAGGPWFQVINTVVSTFEEPLFAPIEFQFDLKKRRAHVKVKGTFETVTEPIKNPITGEEHRVQVCLPDGMEFKIAETGAALVNKGTGKLKYNWPNSHSSLMEVEHTPKGLK